MTVNAISVPVSPGELIDKITILEIKDRRITDAAKRSNVRCELALLQESCDAHIADLPELSRLTDSLREINRRLWDIEDALRRCEHNGDFGPRFVELARSVYRINDERAAVKQTINNLLGSQLVEEKSYAPA